MAAIFVGLSGPRQQRVEPKDVITLGVAPSTTALSSEFRWKESGAANFGAAVAGTTANTYNLPANTWARDKFMVWQARYQDSGGWSDWATFTVDTSGWNTFRADSTQTDIPFGPIGSPGAWVGRVAVRDNSGAKWSDYATQAFTIQASRTLVKDANGRWKGVPILRHNGTTFVEAAHTD